MEFFRFWRQHISHFESTDQVIQKRANFEWGTEQEKGLEQVQAAVQATIPWAVHGIPNRPRGAQSTCAEGGPAWNPWPAATQNHWMDLSILTHDIPFS